MKVAHVLPFTIGIVDYTLRLSDQLFVDYGIESILISVTEPAIPPDSTYLDKFPIYKLVQDEKNPLLDNILKDVSSLIVHFDFELISHGSFFQNLKKTRNDLKIVFMFHEFFPRWPMTLCSKLRLEFKRLTNSKTGNVYRNRLELVQLADYILTNTQIFESCLSQLTKAPITCVPTFSNAGEPKNILPYTDRIPQMIVFGSAGSRERVYKNSAQALVKSCKSLGIQKVIDIGPPIRNFMNILPTDINVVSLGVQSSQEISSILSKSMAGFIDYSHNPIAISKSGVFAAYSAHGLVTVLSQSFNHETDNLKLNEHYVTWKSLKKADSNQIQAIPNKAFNWYQKHNLMECTKAFSLALLP